MPPFLICIHDATPAHARETLRISRDLAPHLGRTLSFGVVPDWHEQWPLTAHAGYCRAVQDASEELLLHGYFHQRRSGWGPVSLLASRCDEMNGLGPEQTTATIERAQRVFEEMFGAPARGFLAPGWQKGHVRQANARSMGLDHVLGFFSLQSSDGRRIPLATWTWDAGRWDWLGHIGHGVGRLLQATHGRVPVLAIHPRDVERGFWPRILRLTRELVDNGYQPTTPAALLGPSRC